MNVYFIAQTPGKDDEIKEINEPSMVKLAYAQRFRLRGILDGESYEEMAYAYPTVGPIFPTKAQADTYIEMTLTIGELRRKLTETEIARQVFARDYSGRNSLPHFKSDRPDRRIGSDAHNRWLNATNGEETLNSSEPTPRSLST